MSASLARPFHAGGTKLVGGTVPLVSSNILDASANDGVILSLRSREIVTRWTPSWRARISSLSPFSIIHAASFMPQSLTQAQLAERVDTTHATISRFETGAMRLDEDWIVLLAAALRIRPGDLFRPPDGNPGTKTLAERIERLSPDQREIAIRLLDALEPEPAKAKGQDR
jgi:transcriptional regulator with XRE-family HTH domain